MLICCRVDTCVSVSRKHDIFKSSERCVQVCMYMYFSQLHSKKVQGYLQWYIQFNQIKHEKVQILGQSKEKHVQYIKRKPQLLEVGHRIKLPRSHSKEGHVIHSFKIHDDFKIKSNPRLGPAQLFLINGTSRHFSQFSHRGRCMKLWTIFSIQAINPVEFYAAIFLKCSSRQIIYDHNPGPRPPTLPKRNFLSGPVQIQGGRPGNIVMNCERLLWGFLSSDPGSVTCQESGLRQLTHFFATSTGRFTHREGLMEMSSHRLGVWGRAGEGV